MAVDPEDLEDLATSPAAASGDAGSFTERPADDVLKLTDRAAAQRGAAKKGRGLRFSKVHFGGQIDGLADS